MRKIQAANLRNGMIPISQKQLHYLSAKGDLLDKKTARIGCSIKVDVKKASVTGFDVGRKHIS